MYLAPCRIRYSGLLYEYFLMKWAVKVFFLGGWGSGGMGGMGGVGGGGGLATFKETHSWK